MELRIRPKSDYLHKADWQELYILTEHWKSDLDFYRDEVRFLHDLVGKYFILMTREENISQLQAITNEISDMETAQQAIAGKIKLHLGHLEELPENAFSRDEQQFRKEHGKLEDELIAFTKSFR